MIFFRRTIRIRLPGAAFRSICTKKTASVPKRCGARAKRRWATGGGAKANSGAALLYIELRWRRLPPLLLRRLKGELRPQSLSLQPLRSSIVVGAGARAFRCLWAPSTPNRAGSSSERRVVAHSKEGRMAAKGMAAIPRRSEVSFGAPPPLLRSPTTAIRRTITITAAPSTTSFSEASKSPERKRSVRRGRAAVRGAAQPSMSTLSSRLFFHPFPPQCWSKFLCSGQQRREQTRNKRRRRSF